ncbi:MAG TPA: hypothetical protein VN752_09890 [Solirubrobacterales bacterium]|nr:hypothetical protein [Solirubrobacterales bacterium]
MGQGDLRGGSVRGLRRWLPVGLVGLLAVAGCGQASSDSGSAESESIDFWSPAVGADGAVSPRVGCGGGTLWLPLKWGSIPSETEELMVYFSRIKREAGEDGPKVKVFFAAMITKISPKLRGIEANTFPEQSEYQYYVSVDNCPWYRSGQHYLVELFALDDPREIPENDRFAVRLGEEAMGVKQFATESEDASELRDEALASGRFVAVYVPS